MELVLNLVWMLLAALMYCLWVRCAPRKGADRRTQLVALALVVVILFPAISVTDDLLTAQNPAETDCRQRKDHVCANAHPVPHLNSESILTFSARHSYGAFHSAVPGDLLAPMTTLPALGSVQNRPPPAG